MDEYRNYGLLILPGQSGGASGSGTSINKVKRSLVYLATHKANDLRTDYMYRSFISFTFGKRHIEDFNLIATFADLGLNDNGYADFEDITTENNVVGGLLYWRTHISTRKLTFTLATDSLTLRNLDDFLSWFAPGKTRELILAEHPNREAYARVSSPPLLLLLPFELQIEVALGYDNFRTTSTTVYRGTITLELVMDEPYWHSLVNILGYADENNSEIFYDIWTDANGQPANIFDSKDALKIVAEDGIPISTMIKDTMVFGDDIIAEMGGTGAIVAPEGISEYYGGTQDPETGIWTFDLTVNLNDWEYWRYRIAKMDGDVFEIGAKINGPHIASANSSSSERILLKNSPQYFYYSGTAKSYPTLKFTITPTLDSNYYISNIRNKFATVSLPYYNTITIESSTKNEFKFTTPGIFTAYNLAIYIFKNIGSNPDIEAIRVKIRDSVKHLAVRAWANYILDKTELNASTLAERMSYFLKDENGDCYPASFIFNSKTGDAIGHFGHRNPPSSSNDSWTAQSGTYTNDREELVGDMIKSSYLVITDRNYPDSDGIISGWIETSPQNSYKLVHDIDTPLTGVVLEYKNMYW